MKDQKKKQDGLPFIGRLFRPDLFRGIVYHLAAKWMLKKVDVSDGRVIHRLPYRKALKRDVWDPSEQALAVEKEWKQSRKVGSTVSFTEEE
jgi:hypothetical protein